MFTNRHVIVAMLVAPVLAVLAWFAVDYFVAERPHAAREGNAYQLVAQSSCRYESGLCELRNADLRLTLRPETLTDTAVSLTLTASHPLESAVAAIVDGGDPEVMAATDDGGKTWWATLPRPASPDARIRLAVTARGATWFAEVTTVFFEVER